MSKIEAERVFRGLLAADRAQEERSYRDGRCHPTFSFRWSDPEAKRALAELTPMEQQRIRFEFNAKS